MLLALDVHYRADHAQSVCIAFEKWEDTALLRTHTVIVNDVAEYEPGAFYKRELPCLLAVLADFDLSEVEAIIVDGYVFLDDSGKWGLGAWLFDALNQRVPVVGVAKTRFQSLTIPSLVAEVLRGESHNPLFVTVIGAELPNIAEKIQKMSGPYRIPELLKKVDELSRL